MSDGDTVHASCVAVEARGLLILGRSGSGKSSLALALMALGADLVADDRVILTPGPQGPVASAPAALSGLIEARGLGILHAAARPSVVLAAAVDLDRVEAERLPPPRVIALAGTDLPLFHGQATPYFHAALMQYLKAGRRA